MRSRPWRGRSTAGSTVPLDPGSTKQAESRLFHQRYRVVKLLGQGGCGRVDLVTDELHGGKRLALKVIIPRFQGAPALEARFRNEIKVLRGLNHPGIPQILNDGRTDDGELYFTMDYVEGTSLEQILEHEGPFALRRIVRISRQLFSILEYAHSMGIVHRDLKPANILVVDPGTEQEQVKVLDFGIAKILRREGPFEAATSLNTCGVIGTPDYMAPEQVSGNDIDEGADYYALGVILYRMVSSRLPFSGKTPMEVATARIDQKPTPIGRETSSAPLRFLINGLLERKRENRPTQEEIGRLLERVLSDQERTRHSTRLAFAAILVVLLANLALLLHDPRPDGVDSPGRGASLVPVDPGKRGRQAATPPAPAQNDSRLEDAGESDVGTPPAPEVDTGTDLDESAVASSGSPDLEETVEAGDQGHPEDLSPSRASNELPAHKGALATMRSDKHSGVLVDLMEVKRRGVILTAAVRVRLEEKDSVNAGRHSLFHMEIVDYATGEQYRSTSVHGGDGGWARDGEIIRFSVPLPRDVERGRVHVRGLGAFDDVAFAPSANKGR